MSVVSRKPNGNVDLIRISGHIESENTHLGSDFEKLRTDAQYKPGLGPVSGFAAAERQQTEQPCGDEPQGGRLGHGVESESHSARFIIYVNPLSISNHISIPVHICFSNEHSVGTWPITPNVYERIILRRTAIITVKAGGKTDSGAIEYGIIQRVGNRVISNHIAIMISDVPARRKQVP